MSHLHHSTALRSAPVSAQVSPNGEKTTHSPPSRPEERRFNRPDAPSDNGRRTSEPSWAMAPSNHVPRPNPDSAASRSLKMHSILNHPGSSDAGTQPSKPGQPDQARGSVHRANEGTTSSSNTANPPAPNLPPMSELTSPFASGSRPQESMEISRRAFPPSSISLSHPGMNSQKSPYASTTTTPQIGTPNGARATYPFPPQSATSTDRRGSDPIATAPQSQSNSPTTSYSSFGHTTKNSPASHYGQMVQHSHHSAPGYGMPPAPVNGHHMHIGEQAYRGASSHPPGTYQLMTLDTGQGPIQVPVDVQAASKMADEKRKRNAGASARFRQRRKEKEREASQTISRLESQIRELGDQKEYYRLERDYFRTLVYQSGTQIHVSPRMPSPKPGQVSLPTRNGSSPGSVDYQQNGERGSDDGRNQRRRISTYSDGGVTPNAQNGPYPPVAGGPAQYAQAAGYGYSRQEARPQMAAGPAGHPNISHGGPQHGQPQYPSQPYNRAWKPPVQ